MADTSLLALSKNENKLNSGAASIVVLVSGGGSNLQVIIDAINAGKIAAQISVVISNIADVYALERAKKAGISTEIIDHTRFNSREEFDIELQSVIDSYKPDLVVLSGFMRLLTTSFVLHYQARMLNIHPSLLPKFRGLHTHKRALEEGEKEHGASVHFVTPDLDSGPIILQAIVPVLNADTPELLAKRVLVQEHMMYPLVISWFVSGRLQLTDNKVLLDNEELSSPLIQKDGELLTQSD